MKIGKYARSTFLTVSILALSLFALQAGAQTKSRKKTVKPKPKTTAAIVVPPQIEPEVVSRDSDYRAENLDGAIVQPETTTTLEQPETVDDKLDKANSRIKELSARIKSLEKGQKNDYDEKQKRLLLNLDILTRAESRAESLRKQLFDMVEKESALNSKLDQIANDIRPEVIERQVSFAGTLRPEELRDNKRKSLEIERKNIQNILTQLQTTRANIETSVQRADAMVEKLRFKLEKDIDDALVEEIKEVH
jgi:hypothetical protein